MRFKVRSLGGKLISVAALTLLLCMVLFAGLSWGLLRYLSEHEARSDATTHLSLLKKIYLAHTATLLQDLEQVAESADITSTVNKVATPATRKHLKDVLEPFTLRYHVFLVTLDILD